MAETTLKPCPCGAVPESLAIMEGGCSKWAWCACGTCGEWSVEFRTNYSQDPEDLQFRAAEAWNRAPCSTTTP